MDQNDDGNGEVQHKLFVEIIKGAIGQRLGGEAMMIEPCSTTCSEETLREDVFDHELRKQLLVLVQQATHR